MEPAQLHICLRATTVLSVLSHAPEQLTALIAAAKQHDVDFVYAISPGLDMTFSSPREVSTLKRKLDQVGLQLEPVCSGKPIESCPLCPPGEAVGLQELLLAVR